MDSKYNELVKYIEANYIDLTVMVSESAFGSSNHAGAAMSCAMPAMQSCAETAKPRKTPKFGLFKAAKEDIAEDICADICFDGAAPSDLDEALKTLDESFREMLFRKIDEKGLTDVECYRKAGVDRKLFSKIRSNSDYKPSKTTAIAFAIALELSLEETNDLLMKAGYALSHSSKFDVIIEYYIKTGRYDIFEINEALFAFDQPVL